MSESLPSASEQMEALGVEALLAEASEELSDQLGLLLQRIGGTLVSIAGEDPSILLNRAIELG